MKHRRMMQIIGGPLAVLAFVMLFASPTRAEEPLAIDQDYNAVMRDKTIEGKGTCFRQFRGMRTPIPCIIAHDEIGNLYHIYSDSNGPAAIYMPESGNYLWVRTDILDRAYPPT